MGTVTVESLDLRFKAGAGGEIIALNNLSMTIPDKEFAVIVGPSGCGKSSLLDIIAGLKEPSGGTCRLDGRPIGGPAKERGMVFQNYSLFPWLTVLKNVEFGLSLQGRPAAETTERARYYVNAVGLSSFENAYPNQLSGGMKQRVAIARSLAMQPTLMLFDEITSALDPELVGEVLRVLEGVAKDGMTMMLVTHEMNFARNVADRVIFMHEGRIHEDGPAREILVTPRTAELRSFLSAVLH